MIIDKSAVSIKDLNQLVVPMTLCARTLQWYHHYLQHPGISRLKETTNTVMYWPSIRPNVKRLVKSWKHCQMGKQPKRMWSKVPRRISNQVLWRKVCVNLSDPYPLKGRDGKIMDCMCLTIIDPAIGWFEMIGLPGTSQLIEKGGRTPVNSFQAIRSVRLFGQKSIFLCLLLHRLSRLTNLCCDTFGWWNIKPIVEIYKLNQNNPKTVALHVFNE